MKSWEYLLKEKPTEFLEVLYYNNKPMKLIEIAKELKTPYPYSIKIANTLEYLKLIEVNKVGRYKLIKLTDKGMDVVIYLIRIKNLLK